jgi:hypothetical protein
MPLRRLKGATGFELFQKPLISSLSNWAISARSAAPGQIQSESQKTYGPDSTDFVLQETYGNSGTALSVKIRSVLDRATKRMSFREVLATDQRDMLV